MRVRIIDVDGKHIAGLALATPEESQPHIGKCGTIVARDIVTGSPLILLDDGAEIWGYDCWWQPEDYESLYQPERPDHQRSENEQQAIDEGWDHS